MKNQTIIKSTASKFSLPFLALLPGVLLATSAVTAHAEAQQTGGIPAEIQSPARPYGDYWFPNSPVMKGGSDSKSAVFQTEVLPELTKFLNGSLGGRTKLDDSRMFLDSNELKLKTASDARVYFVGENTENSNMLAFYNPIESGTWPRGLVFPDASSPVSTYDPANTAERQIPAPLLPGDFVDLGKLDGGSKLGFFFYNGDAGETWYKSRYGNWDGVDHAVAFAYQMPNSPYLIFGLEDTYGGGDYNDVVFALDIGAANVKALTTAPEPAMALTLVSFLGMTLRRKRSLKLA